jgi:hypothetical protein
MTGERNVSTEGVRQALRSIYRADLETNLQIAFVRSLSDPLRPVNQKGRWKPNPALILLSAVFCALAAIFLYFSLGGGQ